MKTTYRILSCVVLLAAAVSCSHKADFTTYPFVCFNSGNASYAVNENDGKLVFPVSAHNVEGTTTVSFEVVPGTAIPGTHYTVEPANGTLTLSGNQSQNITLNIIDNPGVYTGNGSLTINLTSASGGVEVGLAKTIKCTIVDNDIPIDWAFVEGVWNAQDVTLAGAPDGDAYKVKITKVDDTTLKLYNLWGGELDLVGEIEFDGSKSATILFPAAQTVFDASAYGYGPLVLLGVDEAGDWNFVPAAASVTGDGITIGPWNMLITEGDYAYYLWDNGYYTKLTK